MVSNRDVKFLTMMALGVASASHGATEVQVSLRRPLTVYSSNVEGIIIKSDTNPVMISRDTPFSQGYAYADFGVIKTRSSLFGKISVPDSHVVASTYPQTWDRSGAFASWTDDVSIIGGIGYGVANVRLFIDAKYSTEYPTAEGRSSSQALFGLSVNNNDRWDFYSAQIKYTDKDGNHTRTGYTGIYTPTTEEFYTQYTDNIMWSGWNDFEIPFRFGYSFELKVYTYCYTSGDNGVSNGVNPPTTLSGASVGSSCDMGQSVYWGGITGVRTQSGDTVSGYDLFSGSGFDYRNASPELPDIPAVPEPASWVMLIAGFGAVGSAVRRRRLDLAAVGI